MLTWTCTACGAANELLAAEYDDLEIYCQACGKRHYITTEVAAWQIASPEDTDAVDEEREWDDALTVRYPCVRISRDGGQTWAEERVNGVESDPARNLTLRPGDLVENPFNGLRGKIILQDGRLGLVLVEEDRQCTSTS